MARLCVQGVPGPLEEEDRRRDDGGMAGIAWQASRRQRAWRTGAACPGPDTAAPGLVSDCSSCASGWMFAGDTHHKRLAQTPTNERHKRHKRVP
eukprot:scaffold93114_cov64-Phaeocystis_antarctica.AAC.2